MTWVMRPRGSKAELEARRRRAVSLVAEGRTHTEVALLVGATQSSVSKWVRAHAAGGAAALNAKPNAGGQPKLKPGQAKGLARLLHRGARAEGYPNELWTLGRIAKVISKHFGVKLDQSNVWRHLRRMGWSAQRPERRARERDEKAIQIWRKRTWPRIKKGPGRTP